MLDETRLQNWKGLTIPVLPLPQAVFFYNKIERTSKVDLIKSSPHYLKQKNMSEVSKQYYATKKGKQLKNLVEVLTNSSSLGSSRQLAKNELNHAIQDFIETMLLEGEAFQGKIERSKQFDPNYLK